jgi:hypothetical protein
MSKRWAASCAAETFNPEHKLWLHRLTLSEQMPIDGGPEVAGYDKQPSPQRIEIRNATDEFADGIVLGLGLADDRRSGQ